MSSSAAHRFALVDTTPLTAALRAQLAAQPQTRTLFVGLPEAEFDEIQVYLLAIDSPTELWLQAVDEADLFTPCLTMLQSHLSLDELAQHLASHVVADMGDHQTALLRFYDPRLLAPMLKVLPSLAATLLAPIDFWAYRAPGREWQTLPGLGQRSAPSRAMPVLSLQACEALMQVCAPFDVMATMSDDQPTLYAQRWDEFSQHFNRARRWGFEHMNDLMAYCRESFKRGLHFDSRAPMSGYLATYAPKGYPFTQIASMADEQEKKK